MSTSQVCQRRRAGRSPAGQMFRAARDHHQPCLTSAPDRARTCGAATGASRDDGTSTSGRDESLPSRGTLLPTPARGSAGFCANCGKCIGHRRHLHSAGRVAASNRKSAAARTPRAVADRTPATPCPPTARPHWWSRRSSSAASNHASHDCLEGSTRTFTEVRHVFGSPWSVLWRGADSGHRTVAAD